jgi:hypothetical protein
LSPDLQFLAVALGARVRAESAPRPLRQVLTADPSGSPEAQGRAASRRAIQTAAKAVKGDDPLLRLPHLRACGEPVDG